MGYPKRYPARSKWLILGSWQVMVPFSICVVNPRNEALLIKIKNML